jgi:hypothetical protein
MPAYIESRKGPAAFSQRELGLDTDQPLLVRTLRLDTNSFLYAPEWPRVKRDSRSFPALSLVLLLNRQPTADEESISSLIEHGFLNFSVSLSLTPSEIAELNEAEDGTGAPVFARSASFELVDVTGTVIASAQAAGPDSGAALSASLNAQQTIALLSLLNGNEADLKFRTRLAFLFRAAEDQLSKSATWTSEAALQKVIGDSFAGFELNRFVSVVGPGGDTRGLRPSPRLIKAVPSAENRAVSNNSQLPLTAFRNALVSLPLALTPDRSVQPVAHAIVASTMATPVSVHAGAAHMVLASDLILPSDPATENLMSLPVLDDLSVSVWKDRKTQTYWYPPTFVLQTPASDQDPATSPFLFSFSQTGVTAGNGPSPALTGTIRFRIAQSISEAAKSALAALGNPQAASLPTNNLSILLEVPFVDESTNATKTQLFTAALTQSGNIIEATITLMDKWVRLAYGALAYPNFQSQPAKLSIAYAFPAYVPFHGSLVSLANKIHAIEIAPGPVPVSSAVAHPVFHPAEGVLLSPVAATHFNREPGTTTLRNAGISRPGTIISALHVAPATLPVAHLSDITLHALHPLDPGVLHTPITPAPVIPPVRYIVQTTARTESLVALFPCSDNGNFYRQTTSTGEKPVGCQDALRLGEILYQLYEELPEMRDSDYSVYKSLAQPGRFLVSPKAFRITRFAPAEGPDKAYRPTIAIYSRPDPEPDKTLYFFDARLEPAIPLFKRRQLIERLGPLTPFGHRAILDFPTDPVAQAALSYRWAVPDGSDQPSVQQIGNTFQVTLSALLANALLIKTLIEGNGISGLATFTLPDGLSLVSNLILDTFVTGPWGDGPVEIAGSGTALTLTNRIEQSLNLFDLFLEQASGSAHKVPLEILLPSGQSHEVSVTDSDLNGYVSYAPSDASAKISLNELRVFVQDIETTILFVNQVNYSNHSLHRLRLMVRLANTEHSYLADLQESQSASVDMTLSLTTYLETQTIQFQFIKTSTAGDDSTTAWIDWDITSKGNVVSVTWDLIQ